MIKLGWVMFRPSCLILFVLSVCLQPAAAREPDATWAYKTIEGADKPLEMAVFLPADYQTGKRFPVMVWFHGGSWNAGDPNWHYPDCRYWSRRGMVAVSVGYRLRDRDGVQVPRECVADAKAAISHLRRNASELKIDPDRIVAAGDSAGGLLAAATAMIPGEQAAEVADCEPNAIVLTSPWFRTAKPFSPPEHIRADLPPVITFLGDEDQGIPVESLLVWDQEYRTAGNDSELHIGKGGKHGFCNGRNPRNPFFYWSVELTDRFLVRHGILSGSSVVQIPDGVEHLLDAVPIAAGSRLVFIGDSITDMNWGRNEKDRNHYLGHSFVFMLAGRLGLDSPELELDFYNRGKSGNTVAQLRQRWQQDAIDMRPDVLTILIGTNDVGKGVSPQAYERDYRHILQQSRSANPELKIVMLDPFVLKSGAFANNDAAWQQRRAATDALRPIVAKLAKEFGATHIETQAAFDRAVAMAPAEHWIWDGVHPLPQGHELIAREWLKAMGL